MSTPREVPVPTPTRRDKALIRDLGQQVQDTQARHRTPAGLLAENADSAVHRLGASVKTVESMDSWMNFLKGYGTRGDPRRHNQVAWELALTEQDAEDLYAGDDQARKAVDLMPHEATREGLEWVDAKKSQYLAAEYDRLSIFPALRQASIFASLYGGGAIMLNDGVTPVERLVEPWRKGAQVQSLVVLSRWELWAFATELQRDITEPGFGLPLRYRLFPRMTFGQTAMEIHATRIIRFDGKLLPRLAFIKNNFWHDSLLTNLKEPIGDYKMAFAAVSTALTDFRMLVHKIAGLSDAVASGKTANIKTRLEIMNLSRSVLGAWAIDAEDDSQFHSASLAGVADLVKLVKARLQGDTNVPGTIFFNESPAGTLGGSSGGHEERNWYNTVRAWQKNYLDPKILELNKLLLGQTGANAGRPEDHPYTWKSLWQQTELDEAKTNEFNSRGDVAYVNAGVRTPEQVQRQRFPQEAMETPASAEFLKTLEPAEPKAPADPGANEEDPQEDPKPGPDDEE